MLGSALPAPATLQTTTATPTSPTRTSRLRGLSYLRNYSLHSRSDAAPPPLARSTSSPSASAVQSPTSPTASRPRDEHSSSIQNGENGWLPTVQGRSGLSRDSLHPTQSTESASPELPSSMPRARLASAHATTSTDDDVTRRAATRTNREMFVTDDYSLFHGVTDAPPDNTGAARDKEKLPTIRFIPHIEPRAHRPSLNFTAISRTLKQPHSVVFVGRYSEREHSPHNSAAVAPVGFKSKVVSRRHCEFWCANGQWYVKDVKSSSGTFLNHVRLSSPGVESRPYPVNDGDVVQLGIDFKGGEEVIFRCVKIRIECNRGWQRGVNSFNTETHKRVLNQNNQNAGEQGSADTSNASECSICLNPCAPCQSLFVSQCGHVWHFKCVRQLVNGPQYPNFLCPNCRAVVDLEADVEPPEDLEMQDAEESVDAQPDSAGDAEMGDNDQATETRTMGRWSQLLNPTERSTLQNINEDLAENMNEISIHEPESPENIPGSIAIPQSTANAPPEDDRSASTDLRAATPTSSAPFALAAAVNTSTRTSIDIRRDRSQRSQNRPTTNDHSHNPRTPPPPPPGWAYAPNDPRVRPTNIAGPLTNQPLVNIAERQQEIEHARLQLDLEQRHFENLRQQAAGMPVGEDGGQGVDDGQPGSVVARSSRVRNRGDEFEREVERQMQEEEWWADGRGFVDEDGVDR